MKKQKEKKTVQNKMEVSLEKKCNKIQKRKQKWKRKSIKIS